PPVQLPYATALRVASDASILVGTQNLSIMKLTADGMIDPSYGDMGIAAAPIIAETTTLVDFGADHLAVGTEFSTGRSHPAIARYSAGGQLSPVFGDQGLVVVDGVDMAVYAAAVDSRTRILVLGTVASGSGTQLAVIRVIP